MGCLSTLYGLGAPGGMTDGELLDLFVSRPAEAAELAFAALVRRHGGMVLGVCRRSLGDRHAAEDAFQATFLVLAQRARAIRRSDSVGGWLHRVARRVAGRAAYAARRRRGAEGPLIGEVEEMREPGDSLERSDLRVVIDQEIDRLGDDLRQAVVLCDLEGLTYEQAAERLRWPVGTVKSRLSRARGRLRERLSRRGVAPSALAVAGAAWAAEATAGISPALVGAAVRAALAWTGRAGVVPAAVAGLAREEAWSMSVARLRLAAAWVGIVGVSSLLAGLSLARGPGLVAADPAKVPVVTGDSPPAPDPAAGSIRLGASGQVVDAQGRPVPGARVFLREWAIRRTAGMSEAQDRELRRTGKFADILAETRADDEGRFRFEGVAAPSFPSAEDNRHLGKSWFPWDLVALADGHGAAWARLTPRNQTSPVTIALPAESKLRGRVTGPGGRPIAGAAVRVSEIALLSARVRDSGTSEERLDLNWSSVPIESTTDEEGRYEISHLPPERRISVVVTAEGHRQEYFLAATTDRPVPDLEDTTYHSGRTIVANVPVRTGAIDVELRPTDHRLLGRLVAEGSGDPVVGAMVLNGWERVGKTDADGRFTIEELSAGTIELHAKAEDEAWAPLDVALEIPAGEKVVERTFHLPHGVAVSGRVTDGAGGPVAGARLRYEHAADAEGVPTLFGLEATTDAQGGFRLAVPAGRGSIVLVGVPAGYPALQGRAIGSPPAAGFSKPVEGRSGDVVEGLTFVLDRGGRTTVRAVDPDGRPIEGAEVRRYGLVPQDAPPNRTDAEGRAEVAGLLPEATYTVDIVHPARKLGRRLEVGPDEVAAADRPIEVALEKLGSVEGRVLDEGGEPLGGPVLWLRSNVKAPEQLGVPLESANKVGDDGSFRFDGLVPGGSYYVDVAVEGHAGAYSEEVVVEPGAVKRLTPFRLPAADRELKGVVVDPRGKPVAGATVGLDQSGRTQLNPSGRWFMDTDAEGRFHLTNLPRGPLKLMAYRSPAEAGKAIANLVRVEVPAGQAEVRVELPDARRRLQGIEE
jgi:RNA polymerase sigma factor (sigma-70 family)